MRLFQHREQVKSGPGKCKYCRTTGAYGSIDKRPGVNLDMRRVSDARTTSIKTSMRKNTLRWKEQMRARERACVCVYTCDVVHCTPAGLSLHFLCTTLHCTHPPTSYSANIFTLHNTLKFRIRNWSVSAAGCFVFRFSQ